MTNDNTPRQALIPLLHSDIQLPHAQLHVTTLDQLERANGIAFSATLCLDGRIIGSIENDGNGGETWLRSPNSLFGWKAMADFTAGCRRHGQPVTEEEVLNALVDEYDTNEIIRAAMAADDTLLRQRDPDGYILNLINIPGTRHSPQALHAAILAHPDAHADIDTTVWQAWTGDRWTSLSSLPVS